MVSVVENQFEGKQQQKTLPEKEAGSGQELELVPVQLGHAQESGQVMLAKVIHAFICTTVNTFTINQSSFLAGKKKVSCWESFTLHFIIIFIEKKARISPFDETYICHSKYI